MIEKEFETVLYESLKNIGYITLNRPEKHNALSSQLLDDIDAVFDYAEADDNAKVIVLKGAGKSFCSGFDLNQSYYITPPEGGWKYKNSYNILNNKIFAKYPRILNFPKPTIAQVHGYCTDAGCYLQLLCDITLAADDAVLGHPAQLWGGAQSLPLWQFYLGIKKARYLLMSGRRISGKEAAEMGLVSISVPREELEAEVNKLAAEIAKIPHEGALHNKIALNTDLKIRGIDALFEYYGQMNRYGRLFRKK
ncbi:MAG: enoyl-CoA hydratase/isomerase family protein [Promethearchaeota archaeon]|nr:MAG: enoyl-CoA hydratase/isomerase family protein [Candidatus Lokiarchaeota archaeon]